MRARANGNSAGNCARVVWYTDFGGRVQMQLPLSRAMEAAQRSVRSDDETTAGNYFVSNYPPYSFWTQDHVAEAYAALDRRPAPGTPLGIYFHIPFCRKRCHFCYFKVYTDK